ncbi:MAG: DUF4249 domain-containing protein [Bacteroidia bacterium]|nr:DUF4249 domain-containing protein [Bacteroidia bacterium]
MKTNFRLLISLIILFGLIGCEKVIDLELQEANPSLVVEGLVTDDPAFPYMVRLTRTKNYFAQTLAPAELNAFVTIADDVGNLDTLYYQSDPTGKTSGAYYPRTPKIGAIGRTYTLFIRTQDGKEYRSISKMEYMNDLDSVRAVYQEASSVRQEGYYPMFFGQEYPVLGNKYRWKIYRNDTLLIDPIPILVNDDKYVNGSYIMAQLPFRFQLGDSIRLDMFSLDEAGLYYYLALQNQLTRIGSPFDAPPASLPTNITGGAMGLFQASAFSRVATRVR